MGGLQMMLVNRGRLLAATDVDRSLEGSAFALRFEEGTTLVVANETDDSILIADVEDLSSLAGVLSERQFEELRALLDAHAHSVAEPPRDLRAMPMWSQVIGTSPVWAWFLTNNLDVRDGMQIEFADAARKRTTVQFLVSASQITVRLMKD